MKVLITGGSGYIGKNISKHLKNYDVVTSTRQNLELLTLDQVNKFFEKTYFDVVIHTAIVGGSRLVEDSSDIVRDNVQMLCNIINNKSHYGKLISIGSGAELFASDTPYGMSKRIISDIINLFDNHYNLRVFGIFDENELDTRFIKANIINYISNRDIVIHKDKYMDFFGFKDFVKVLERYITNDTKLPKTFDCCYTEKYKLSDIAAIINNLESKKVPIKFLDGECSESYIGTSQNQLCIDYAGLEKNIRNMFEVLKNKVYNI